ncbi:MAG: translation initiation factor IF-2 [Candidatus Omnitrophota bacterium]
MRVSDLAKELGVTNEDILAKLKTLHLKAKDGKQELNVAVIAVLRSALKGVAKPQAKKEKEITGQEKSAKEAKAKTPKEKKAKKETQEKQKEAKPSLSKKVEAQVTKTAKGKGALKEKKVSVKKPKVEKAQEGKKKEIKKEPVIEEVILKRPYSMKQRSRPFFAAPTSSSFKIEDKKKDTQNIAEHPETAQVKEVQEKAEGPLKEIEIACPISVKDLAVRLQQKPSVLLKSLMQKGFFANINQSLDEELVKKMAEEFGFALIKVKSREEQIIDFHKLQGEDPKLLKPRAPIVTFMGHVDHGKTSLLDKIRKSKLTDKEHGGITQHIGAYSVTLPKGKITFLDTPGHEAFTSMRARGAHITDLVVLVVAAEEGIMPQTEEAIDHARAANVPIIVALNKIDKKNADPDLVKKQLVKKDLTPEDWGGKTVVAGVSALTGEGIDTLLEMILLEAELLELKANYEKKATGIVVEAELCHGKGPLATVIVHNGVLKEGDVIIAGPHYGKIKAMLDDHKRSIKEAGPSDPAEVLGLSGVPEAGEIFYVVEDERKAKEISDQRQQQLRHKKMQSTGKITLEDLYAQIQAGTIKELRIILKADVQGSLEAVKENLDKITTKDVQIKFIHTGMGLINSSDVILAAASDAIILGFNVDVDPRAQQELEKNPVDVRTYRIIYDAIKDIKNALEGLLEPKLKKKFLAKIEVRQVFKLSRSGIIAGCFVQKGKIHRKAKVDVLRNGEVVFSGSISSLKRFKDDVRDVGEGFECGISLENYSEIQAGDIIEAYEIEKIARTL